MNATIINVGNELLNGKTVNENLLFLSRELTSIGITCTDARIIQDDQLSIKNALLACHNPLIIFTGGLGPTQDDMTKEVIAETLGVPLYLDKESQHRIDKYFKKMNKETSHSNIKQAYFPKNTIILNNDYGTAPGAIIKHNNQTIILLPGPPSEMRPMFKNVIKYLENQISTPLYSNGYLISGIGEAEMEDRLQTLYQEHKTVNIAPYASLGEIRYLFTSTNQSALKNALEAFKTDFKEYIVGSYDTSIEQEIVNLLLNRNQQISVVESCTGGMIASRLVNVEGVSPVFKESYVLYDNQSKIKQLNVPKTILESHGAVSEQCANEMSVLLHKKSNADITLSVTGIAGPSGGSKDKPIGTVYFGLTYLGLTHTHHRIFSGDRNMIRQKATSYGLHLVFRRLYNENID